MWASTLCCFFQEEYEVLNLLDFNNERKRMSVGFPLAFWLYDAYVSICIDHSEIWGPDYLVLQRSR